MLNDCPFLKSGPRWPGDAPYRCAVGVNFCSVGPERQLCRTCPIADWGQVLQCEHLDVYTSLRPDAQGKHSVQVKMECHQPRGMLSDSERCAICPERREAGPGGR